MSRFVRLFRYDPAKDPTARLRIECDSGWNNAVLSDEDVHAEQAENPDARHIVTRATIDMTTREVRWLATATSELADRMEQRDAEDQAELDARRAKETP